MSIQNVTYYIVPIPDYGWLYNKNALNGISGRFYEFVSFDMDVSERTKQFCPFIILFSLWCLASHYYALEEKLISVCL